MVRLLVVLLLLAPFFSLPSAIKAERAAIEDDRGRVILPEAPRRVVALSWAMAENLLALEVEPLAVADPEGYRTWVKRPEMPDSVVDVGLRQDPNLELIAELEPDVILASDDQIALAPKLETIAPVVYFDAFRADQNNFAASRRIFRELGRFLERSEKAEDRLDALDRKLAALREQVQEQFNGDPPTVTIIRFIDAARVVAHGENAMPTYALNALEIENGFPLPPSDWGITLKRVQDLVAVEDGVLFYLEPFQNEDELFSKPIWQELPIVRTGDIEALPPTWTYGGPLSVGYLAEAIVAGLSNLDEQ